MYTTALRFPGGRRAVVVATAALAVGAVAVVAPSPVTVEAAAAGIAPASASVTLLAGAVTAAGATAVVAASTVPAATTVRTTTVRSTAAVTAPRTTTASRSSVRMKVASVAPSRIGTKAYSKWFAQVTMVRTYRWTTTAQFTCLVSLWTRESGWSHTAHNRDGAHGIPQALPGSKMAKAGPNWRTNPETQIKWGLNYIKKRYGTPCGAWSHFRSHRWY